MPPTKLRRMRILDEIEFIRRKNRLSKYRPRRKASTASTSERIKRGRPLNIFPTLRQSYEFKKILKWFIEPMLNAPSFEALSIEERLDLLFCVSTRDIVPAVCVREISKMPGLVVQEDGVRRPPMTSEAKFPKGCPVFVRIDDTTPGIVEVENCEKPDLLFVMTAIEYKSFVIDNLREIEGCNYRLDPPGQIREKDGSYTDVI